MQDDLKRNWRRWRLLGIATAGFVVMTLVVFVAGYFGLSSTRDTIVDSSRGVVDVKRRDFAVRMPIVAWLPVARIEALVTGRHVMIHSERDGYRMVVFKD